MFLDVLDTARTMVKVNSDEICGQNMIQGESMLYYTLLMGKKPTLTQTQVADSNIIFNILNGKYKEEFLKLIEENKIRICLYPGISSLQEYFIKCLSYGLENEEDFFDFAMFPFLNTENYSYRDRKNIQRRMIQIIINNERNFNIEGITQEENNFVKAYIEGIERIDKIANPRYIKSTGFKDHIDNVFKRYADEILSSENYLPQTKELIGVINDCKNSKGSLNRRSSYYSLLESNLIKSNFDIKDIENVKCIIDCSYNIAVASAVNDGEGANINIRNEYIDASKVVGMVESCEEKKIFDLKAVESKNYLTWENLIPLLNELERLEAKGCTRHEALKEIRYMRVLNPIIGISKYIGLTMLTSYLPVAPIVEVVATIVGGVVQDAASEWLKKPSLKEIKDNTAKSRADVLALNQAIKFNSFIAR